MQHTTKYKFNLIETSDAFSPEALNANAEAAERELAALADADAATDAALAALTADVHPGAQGQIARIVHITYVGTGTSGSSKPTRLEFDFKPLLVFVCSTADDYSHIMMRPGASSIGSELPVMVTWSEQSVSWYSAYSVPAHQCNTKGVTYYYTAIGVPLE